MPQKTYLVRLKLSRASFRQVEVASAEIPGDHLAFLNSEGQLVALFLMELVESCNEIDDAEPL